MRPAHVREDDIAESVAAIGQVGEGTNPSRGLIEFIKPVAVEEMPEVVATTDVETDVTDSVKFVDRLDAIIANRSWHSVYYILPYKKPHTPRENQERLVLEVSWKKWKKSQALMQLHMEFPGAKNIPPWLAVIF